MRPGAIILAIAVCAPRAVRADGVTATVGGGLDVAHDGTGVAWGTRVTIGSRDLLGLELGFVGTDHALAGGGSLDGNAVDAAVRLAPWPRHAWTPYAFAGLGWQRYDTSGSMMRAPADAPTWPAGGGLQFRLGGGVVLDARATYRASTIDSWTAGASLGLEL
ncbi:MAG TPA: hypothetical protein VGF94_08315 [Kofleriaceae bacterium]